MTPASPSRKSRSKDDDPGPPFLPPLAILALTIISCGIFLWIWAFMWGNWIKKVEPSSRVLLYTQANFVPGGLLYINLPSLLLAIRINDLTEVARLKIGVTLWGTIASVALIATGISIVLAYRRIRARRQTPLS
ncbi:MAG TPA: hypothetical protein VGL53_03770 [Bryobacteraceae bacterium]